MKTWNYGSSNGTYIEFYSLKCKKMDPIRRNGMICAEILCGDQPHHSGNVAGDCGSCTFRGRGPMPRCPHVCPRPPNLSAQKTNVIRVISLRSMKMSWYLLFVRERSLCLFHCEDVQHLTQSDALSLFSSLRRYSMLMYRSYITYLDISEMREFSMADKSGLHASCCS